MIGDPSGRSTERNLLDVATLEANVAAIRAQLERFLDFTPGSGAVMVNNLDWLGTLSLIEFLRDTGKHFTIPYMLAKDSVQVRLDRGLSFTEFSYMLLQSYDFAHLHREYGRRAPDGRRRPVGQHHGRARADPADEPARRGQAAEDARSGPRSRLQAAAVAVGHEVRQERGGRVGLAGPGADVAVRVLPALAQHRRPRRRYVPALVHRALARGDRGARGGAGTRAREAGRRSARSRCDITARTHGAEAAAARPSPIRRPSSRPRPIADPAVLASLYESAGGFTFDPAVAWPGGSRSCWPRPALFASQGRGPADDRGRRRDRQRRRG